jgi:hypothetical protein
LVSVPPGGGKSEHQVPLHKQYFFRGKNFLITFTLSGTEEIP